MARTKLRPTWLTLVGIGLLMSLFLVPSNASASGGGGCGRRVTDATGLTVTIRQFCFGPTIMRVAPGQTVTWINRDPFPHTVVGANAVWGGFSALKRSARVSYRFIRSGVYPYVCTFHPGMVGAIVVGDGAGLGSAKTTTTAAGPVTLVSPRTGTRSVPLAVAQPTQAHTELGVWLARLGATLILMLIARMVWWMHRRRVATASP